MAEESFARTVLTAMHQALQTQGRSLRSVERALGLGRGYLSRMFSGGHDPRFSVYVRIIEETRLDPSLLMGGAGVGELDPVRFLLARAAAEGKRWRHRRSVDAAIQAIDAAAPTPLRSPWRDLDACAERARHLSAQLPSQQRHNYARTARYARAPFPEVMLDHLDELRDDDPESAREGAMALLTHLAPRLDGDRPTRRAVAARALGIAGSACRQRLDLSGAACALGHGLALAEESSPRATAELLQRASYLVADWGLFNWGLFMLGAAEKRLWALADGEPLLVRAQIDKARLFIWEGEDRAAIGLLRWAARQDPASRRYRFATFQLLALANRKLGELEAAIERLRQAETLLGGEASMNGAKLRGTRAVIEREVGRLPSSVESFEAAAAWFEVCEAYEHVVAMEVNHLHARALAGMRLPRANRDRLNRAVGYLPEDVQASAIACEVVRAWLAGTLSVELLAKLAAVVLKEERAPHERAPGEISPY